MARTTTETMGLCERVLEFIRTNRAALENAGISAAILENGLQADHQEFVQEEVIQENMKAALREQTAKVTAAKNKADKKAADSLRIVAGALGSSSELGKQAAQLSSSLRRPRTRASAPKSPASGT
jgi:hypothetical protein